MDTEQVAGQGMDAAEDIEGQEELDFSALDNSDSSPDDSRPDSEGEGGEGVPEGDGSPPAAPPEQQVPATVVAAQRRRAREAEEKARTLELELAEMRGRISGQKPAEQPPPKSPLDDLDSDEPLTAADVRRLHQWQQEQAAKQAALEKEQAEKQQAEAASKTQRETMERSRARAMAVYTAEKLGPGLDYSTATAIGQHNLSRGDWLNIQDAGDDAGKLFYQLCVKKTPELYKLWQHRAKTMPPPAAGTNKDTADTAGKGQEGLQGQSEGMHGELVDFLFA